MRIPIARLNEFTRAAVLKYQPEGLTEEERPDWESIRDEVRDNPGPPSAWCGTASSPEVRSERYLGLQVGTRRACDRGGAGDECLYRDGLE